MDRLRALALEGMAPAPTAPLVRHRKRATDDGLAPPIPAGAKAPEREEIPTAMRDDAERAWRRAARPWTPAIERLVALGVVSLRVRGCDVEVTMRNGTQRATELPKPWVAVTVAMLTGRELPAVRAALRRGVNLFVPERPRDEGPP